MKFALLIFYAAGTLAAPVLDDRYPKAEVKDIACSGTRFRPGTTFEYMYGGETVNNVEGTTKQSTGLQLSTRVFITQLVGCDFHMRLADTKLSTKSMDQQDFEKNAESAAFQDSLEKNDLIFTMDGDTITTLRPRDTETTEALNIKRGILSTMQLDESTTSETDVNGVCEYKITKKDGIIVKTKSLSECSDRAQNEIGIQSSSIKTAADLKPLNSQSTCTYSLDAGTIRSVICEENHLFRPFSAGYKTSSGAMTIVKQEMKFEGYKANKIEVDTNSYRLKKLLKFDHPEETKQAESLSEQVEVVIKRLIDQSYLSAKKTSAQEFTSLVMLFRKMSKSKMTAIWAKYFDCVESKVCASNDLKDLYRQYMLDAIAYCGTPSCISVVKDVTISGEIAGERANMFLQSIALVAKTTNSMIRDILDIAKQMPSRQVYLTLGTLISRHCAKSPAECGVQAGNAVTQAENFLEESLGECKGQDDHERVEKILITLKAIGNAKRPTNARSALIRCAKNAIHSNITVSAFDALRGMPCETNTLGELRQVIANENIDADKRIYAFQAAMKCPTKDDNLELLVQQYNMEKNNQLASFMWTFFTNLLESSDPDNKAAQKLLTTITKETPLKKNDLPAYQYSKYFEKSLYIDSLKTGATARANLVFHPDGFLPKTAMFDMTAKVMGVPIDLVETVVGIDGIETVLENAFGPDGVLPKDFKFDMFNWTFSTEKLKEMVQTKLKRKRREVKTTEDKAMINDIHDTINKQPTQPSGFMTLKVMGQEVRIMSYDDIYAMIDQIDNMNVIQLLLNWAKGGQKTFSKSMMFLEMTHTVPTGVGLPLRLKLTGSTVGTVELNGKFDIRSMLWGPAGLNINGFIKPTSVVDISGNMGIESTFVSTGLLVSSNMMVSNMLKGSINYKEGEILKINLDTPEAPVQVFHMSSTPFMFMNGKVDMIEGVPRMIKADKCLKSEIIGYGLCTSVRVPVAFRNYEAPYFPLSGPAHVGLSLVRGDKNLKTFQFLTTMTKVANGVEGVIEFSTPGAAYERTLGAKMLYTDANNDKVLTLSTKNDLASIKFSYNGISHTTSVEAKNNLFKKDMVARIVYFNRTSEASQQFGLEVSAEYDWYKFKHETKYVKKATGHALKTTTEYAPNKAISATVKYISAEQKLKATFDMDQFQQSVEVSGKWEWTATTKGATFALVHVPTGKSASVYVGYQTDKDKKEIVTSAVIMGKPFKNYLGWYRDGDKDMIKNFLLFDRKSATFDITYENKNEMKELQINADVFERRAFVNVLYADRGAQKIIRLIADVLGRRASTNAVITNMDVEKSIRITVDAAGKKAEATVGYYNMKDLTIFKINGELLGKKAELYWKLKNTGGYESTVGAVFDKYVAGLRSEYSNTDPKKKSVCSTVYYGTTEEEKIAAEACIKHNTLDTATDKHRQVVCSVELPTLNKTMSVVKDITYAAGRVDVAIKGMYNEKVLCTKSLKLRFADPANSVIEFDMEMGKYTGGWKVYTQRTKAGGVIDNGLLLKAMGKTLLFLNKYEQVQGKGETKTKVTSSIVINEKEMPVTTDLVFFNRNGESVVSASINVAGYTLKHNTAVLYGNKKYGVGFATELLSGGESLSKVFVDYVATVSESQWAFDQMFGFSIKAREYKYGWHIEYENKSFGMKRVHVLKANVQYATSRFSTITLMFADSEKMFSMEIDVAYIPSRKISHFLRYDKKAQELDVSIEFLPQMFAKFKGNLDAKKGYELTTTTSLDWKDFSRVLKVFSTYINNGKMFMVSTSIGGDVSVALKFNKLSPKALTFTVTAFGNTAKLIAAYQNMQLKLDFVVNEKSLIKLEGNYDPVSKSIRLFAIRGEKVVFDIGYNKLINAFNMVLTGAKQWVGVELITKGQRTIVGFSLLNKGIAKVILNKKENTLSIQLKSTASYLFKYNPESKTVSMTIKTRSNRITLMASADWDNKLASVHALINKERFGIKVFFLKKSLNIKLIATPFITTKTILSYTDNTFNMVIQRITKNKVTKEVSFKYVLSKKTCEFLFNWNTETITKIVELIQPLVQTTVKDAKALLNTAWSNAGNLIQVTKEAKAEILNFINKMEKAFDDFDFVAARDEVGSITLKALKKLSAVTVKALSSLATILDNVKAGMPETVEKLKGLINDVKALNLNLGIKAKELLAKAKVVITKGKDIIIEGQEMLKTMKIDENVREILDVMTKVTANLTEATRPVVMKAIALLKDFKIRGKRMEDIVNMATTEGKKYMKMTIEKATATLGELKVKATMKLNELKANIIAASNKATDYLMKMKVPYTSKTVAQLLEIIKMKITELKEKVNTMDVKAIMDDMKVTIMDYKIKGKSVTEYVNDVQTKFTELKKVVIMLVKDYEQAMKDLPESTRQALHKVVAGARTYIKDMDKYITTMNELIFQVTKFTKPLVNHLKFVQTSINKHFGPLFKGIVTKIVTKLNEIELPSITPIIEAELEKISAFFVPLLRPIVPLYRNLLGQVRGLNVMGFRIGTVFDMQVSMINDNMKDMVVMARKRMNTQMESLNKIVEDLKKATPEKVIDTSIDTSVKICNQIVNYLNTMYNDREVLVKKAMGEVMTVYNKLTAQYKKVTSKSIDQVTEEIIKRSSDNIMLTAGELSNLIKQIVAMDISNPTWKAWTDADVLGHLEKFGVNEKIRMAIKSAKDAKIADVIYKTISNIEKLVKLTIMESSVKAIEMYRKLDIVFKYVKSIPKKDYETWLNEMVTFTLSNKAALEKVLNVIYESSRMQALKAYETLQKMAKADVSKVYKKYFAVAEQWYNTIAKKSQMVYSEVKQPTIDVYNHYKDIIVDVVEYYGSIVEGIFTEGFEKTYAKITKLVVKLQKKVEESVKNLKAKAADIKEIITKMYADFIAKYGDLTWDDIAVKIETVVLKQLEKTKEQIVMQYEKILKKTNEIKAIVEAKLLDTYKNAVAEYNKIVVTLKTKIEDFKTYVETKYNEIKPKVMKTYRKYEEMVKMEADKLISKAKTMYADAKAKTTEIYNKNKDKTLKQIYDEIKKFILANYLKQKEFLRAMANKNFEKATQLLNEAKTKVADMYKKVNLKMKTIIVPELMAEAESIINQTLRNTVIMTKEIIKAYTPQAIVIRDAAKKYIDIIKVQAPALLAKAKAYLKMDVAKVAEMLTLTISKMELKIKDVIDAIKTNPKFIKYGAILEAKLIQLKSIIKEKVLELKSNPALMKMKTEIEARIVELKKLIEVKVGEVMANPKVGAAIKVLTARIAEYQTKLDLYVKQAIVLLKQIQKSGKFTAEQLQINLKPHLDLATAKVAGSLASIPTIASHSLQYFADAPEDAFWYGIEVWSEAVKGAYSYAKLLTKQQVIDSWLACYGQAVTFSKDLYTKSTDEWTKKTVNTLYDEAMKTYNDIRTQYITLLEQGKGLPALIKAYYEKNLAIIEKKIAAMNLPKLYNEVIDACKKYYEDSVCKAFIENPIWGELADELANHELTALAKEIKAIVTVKVTELKEKLVPILKEKYTALTAIIGMNIRKMKTETLALYKNLIEKYTWLINNAEKIFEETTLADVVAIVEKQYKQALEKFDQLKEKLNTLKVKYTAKVMEFYSKLETKVMKLVEEYKGKLMPYYVELMAFYNKYYKEMVTKTTELMEKVVAKYNTLKATAEIKYREIVAETMYLFNKYKVMTIDEIKKTREMLMKTWEESEIRAKLNTFRKMTIKQTIEALKKLPTAVYKDLVEKYNKFITELETILKDILSKIETQVKKIMKMLKPYLVDGKVVYKWLENEIMETAKFVYNFYELEKEYNRIKDFIVAETKRIITITKRSLPMIPMILRKYADVYKTSLKKSATQYVEKYQKLVEVYARSAKDLAARTRDKTLRGIHTGLKLVDTFDIEKVKTNVMNFITKLSDYVIVSTKDGELSIKIIHPNLKQAVVYYVNLVKITAKKTLKDLNVKAKQMLKKIKIELDDIKVRADKLRVQIQEAIMRSTAEMRRDFNISFKVNKNIVNRIYEVVKAVVMRNYRLAKVQYDVLEKKALAMINDVTVMSRAYYAQLALGAQVAYVKVEKIVLDIASAKSPKEMYQKIVMYVTEFYETLKKEGNAILEQYRPLITPQLKKMKTVLNSYYKALERVYKQLKNGFPAKEVLKVYLNKIKKLSATIMNKADKTMGKLTKVVIAATETYSGYLKTAYEQLKAGIPVAEVLKPLLSKLQAIYLKLRNFVQKSDLRRTLCANNLELCKLIDESLVVHKMLVSKYVQKVTDYVSTSKAHVDRAVRKLNKVVEDRNVAEKYIATAMIMGDYILTFDNQLYNFIDFVKTRNGGVSPCKYLLARDFQDKKFTIIKSDGAITVETPDMAIKIREDGRTRTTIGNEVSSSLPVEAGSSQCVRIDNLILCHFKDQRMKVTVDLKNLFTIISISGWYKGKSRGLLGTYNNEAHDEWRLPSNKITKNINEFANAYELTGKSQCKLEAKADHTTTCLKPMSKKCKTYFASKGSPFAEFKDALNPRPFMDICKQATKCTKRAASKAHCSVVAAYVAMLRTKGIWVSQPNECMADRGRDVNEEWVQKPMKKALDVVVMVSQKENMFKDRKRVAATMYQLHKALKADKFQVRYALIGFGGAGIHEAAHTHPLRRGQTVFGYILDLNREMKNMPYAGKEAHTNDGYHAILMASKLKFRPGAEKAFIMFNSEPHSSHESGPSFDETKYILKNEANAPLIVFDTVNFPNFGESAGRVIGVTARKLYTTKNLKGTTSKNLDLPASEFKSLVLLSKGGLFSNTAFKKPKQAAISLHDTVLNWINTDIQVCKRCVLRNSWTGQSRPICVSDPTAGCLLPNKSE